MSMDGLPARSPEVRATVDRDVLIRLQTAAADRGITIPTLLRELIAAGLEALDVKPPAPRPPEEVAAAIHQAAATRPVAYRRDWAAFTRWCAGHKVDPATADAGDLIRFVGDLLDAGQSPTTAARRVAGVASIYRVAGRVDDPTRDAELRRVLTEARRRHERSRRAEGEAAA